MPVAIIGAIIAAAATITASAIGAASASEVSGDVLKGLKIKGVTEYEKQKLEGISKNTDLSILAMIVLIAGAFIFVVQIVR